MLLLCDLLVLSIPNALQDRWQSKIEFSYAP